MNMSLSIRLALILFLLAGLVIAAPARPPALAQPEAGTFSASARAVLAALPGQAMSTFIVTLADQLDASQALPGPLPQPGALQAPLQARTARRQAVVGALQDYAGASQRGLLALADELRRAGQVGRVTSFWIFNGLSVEATAAGIRALASRPEVVEVRPDPDPDLQIILDGSDKDPSMANFWRPLYQKSAIEALSDPQPNITLVNAPALWDLGFTGAGIIIASLDSGVDLSHPDLVSSYRGGSNSWYDPYRSTSVPYDPNPQGHGTHTMGIMVGSPPSGPLPNGYGTIGMAPGAKWIAAKVFPDPDSGQAVLETNFHKALQWVLDPDGDPATPDGADVVNNSWGYNSISGACIINFAQDILNLRQAGVLPVFSAGNGGLGDITFTDGSPANNFGALAVGAIDNSSNVAPSSARGPSACHTGRPFPSLAAPGVNVLSSIPVRSLGLPPYGYLSGTSMAAPHVSGAAALLLSAYPDLPLAVLEYALTRGAFDLDEPGPDNNSGYGRLDVLGAYQLASAMWGRPYRTFIGVGRFIVLYYVPVVR